MLPDPVPRDAERALARFGLLGEGAAPVFTPGARYPLAGLLLALPPLAQSGLLDCARQVYGRLRNGFYGLEVMLVVLVFMALLREARAEGATRIPPAALGRVLGLDRAPEVKTIRRKLAELAAAGKAADLQLALARHHAAASPDTLGFLYIDGHTRAYFGKRDIQKMHVARLKFPGPATEETWVTGSAGDPLLVVMAQPSSSLAAQIRDLLPALRDIAGPAAKPVLVLRPRRLVPGPVRGHHRRRVRPADLPQERRRQGHPRPARGRVHRRRLDRRRRPRPRATTSPTPRSS